MARRNRILSYEALRTFAIVSVVAIHCFRWYRDALPASSSLFVLDDLLHYAVPLFVFISGVFAWGGEPGEWPGAYLRFLGRRFLTVAVPYFAWSALYLSLAAAEASRPLTSSKAIALLLTGNSWYHLYFIPMLFVFYLMTPIARRVAKYSPELLLVVAYAIRIVYGQSIAGVAADTLGQAGWQFATHVITHLPEMALGAWFAKRESQLPKKSWVSLLLLGWGSAVLIGASLGESASLPQFAQPYVYPLGMAAMALGFAIGASMIERPLQRVEGLVTAGGTLAFGVYLVHPLYLFGVREVLEAYSAEALWMTPWFAVTVWVGVTALSFATAAALARMRDKLLRPTKAALVAKGSARGIG